MEIIGNNTHHKLLSNTWFWGYSSSYYKVEKAYQKYGVISYYTDIFTNIKRK